MFSDAVTYGVFYQRLQQKCRDKAVEGIGRGVNVNREALAKADALNADVEV